MTRKSRKGKHYRQKAEARRNSTSAIAAVSILALIFALCLWVPLALADDGETAALSGTDTGSALTAGQVAPDGVAGTDATQPGDDSAPDDGSTQAGATAGGATTTFDGDEDGGSSDEGTGSNEASGADTATAVIAGASTSGVAVTADAGSNECDAASAAGSEYGDGCDPEYKLELICSWGENGTYWDSMDDYNAGLLSILYHLQNNGTGNAYNLSITSATATNGVTLATDLNSIVLGDLGPGEFVNFILKWLVPKKVGHYETNIEICADCQQPVCPEGECPPVDPCIENPELCQPLDPCIEDPTLCNPIDPGNVGPTETTAATVAPVLTRSALPSTGSSMLPGVIAAMALLAIGTMVYLATRSRQHES